MMQLRAVTQTSSQLHLIIIFISKALALSDSCESICQSLYNEAVSINGSKCIRFLVSVPDRGGTVPDTSLQVPGATCTVPDTTSM